MIVTPKDVVEAARGWLGVPYRHQGRDRRGIDCVGVPIVIARSLGLIAPDFDTEIYGRLPTGEMIGRLERQCSRAPYAAPGTMLVIAWTRVAAHVAVCTGETMIHAYEGVGRVIEHGYRGRWIRMTHSVWRFPGVMYE